jgi:putative FmdB family regulatory protein
MPTYEYACSKCDERFDVYQSFSDEPLKRHKGCGGKLTKVFGPVGIVLKGSGFYKTDNRSSSTIKAAKKDSESSSSSDSSSGSGSSDSGSNNGSSDSSKSDAAKSDSSKSSESKKSDSSKKADTKSSSAKSKSA